MFRVTPMAWSTAKVMSMDSGMDRDTNSAERPPMNSRTTASTSTSRR